MAVEVGPVVVVAVEVDPVVPPVVTTAGMVGGSVSPLRTCWTSSSSPPDCTDECLGEIEIGFLFLGCLAALTSFFLAGIVK